MPDPQLRLRQQAVKNLALLAPGRLAGRFAGLRRPVPDKAPAVERGRRKMVGGEQQKPLQQVAAGGDAVWRITFQPIAASQLKICCRLYQQA